MIIARHAGFQGQLDRGQHGLLVVVQHERQDLHHLPVAAGLLEQDGLQPSEALRQFTEGRAVPQRPGFALQHRQVVAPVVDGLTGGVMAPVDDAGAHAMPNV